MRSTSVRAGTILDLSSIEIYNSQFNDGNGTVRAHTVSASNGGHVDFRGLTSIITPARAEDRIDLEAQSGGSIDLTALQHISGVGQARFVIDSESSITVGDLTVTNNLGISVNDPTSVFDVDGSLLLDSGATVGVATGVLLYFFEPEDESGVGVTVAPTASADGGGISVGGRF